MPTVKCDNCGHSVEVEDSTNDGEDPEFLYRYRSMASRNLDRTFTHSELYFSRPDQFNDPFDFKTRFTFSNCKTDDVKLYFDNSTKEHRPDLTDTEREEVVKYFVDQYKKGNTDFPQKMEDLMDNKLPEMTKALKVLCLSKVYYDILMWSHYANGHRGIVLQFDKSTLKKQFYGCKKVVYYPTFPTLRDFNKRQEELFILSKSKHWGYEGEWRIIEPVKGEEINDAGKVYSFGNNALTGVILGCEISNEDVSRVFIWRDSGQPQARIYRAKKDKDTYAINVDFSCSE